MAILVVDDLATLQRLLRRLGGPEFIRVDSEPGPGEYRVEGDGPWLLTRGPLPMVMPGPPRSAPPPPPPTPAPAPRRARQERPPKPPPAPRRSYDERFLILLETGVPWSYRRCARCDGHRLILDGLCWACERPAIFARYEERLGPDMSTSTPTP